MLFLTFDVNLMKKIKNIITKQLSNQFKNLFNYCELNYRGAYVMDICQKQ